MIGMSGVVRRTSTRTQRRRTTLPYLDRLGRTIREDFAYDGSGLLVSASVGGAAATAFGHDAAGNRVRVDDPHRGEARYEWTALGELRRRTDADGATVWAYDRLGRAVSRDGPDGFARWAYDAPNGAGMLAARCLYASAPRADCGGSPEFAERAVYGADARPSSATTTIRAGGETREHVHRYAYDRFGRLSETAYPSGLRTRREYNARGHRTALWTGGTLLLETKATDARGSATLLAHLGGGETAREFDPASGRPVSVSAKAADGSAPMRQAYAWRTDATLAWREDRGLLADGAAPPRREAFERDALGRLVAARTKTGDRERTLSYAYDALGSLLSRGDSAGGAMSTAGYGTGALGPNAARHATVDGVRRELEYDALGRVTAYRACASPAGRCERSNAEADLTVKWNARGLATEVAAGADRGGAREFLAYGPDGARRYRESEWTEKDGEGVEVRRKRRAYRVGAYEEILPDASSPWASVERTSLAGGSVLHVRATRRDGSVETTIRHLHADQAGSPAATTGAAGGALRRTAHDPYGARRSADWSGTLDEAGLEALLADEDLGGALGFGGHEQLDRVGLVDMAGRLYDPELGRFLGPDPYVADMASGQDWNAYAYVGGRPASRTDPTGRIRAGPMCNLPGVICMQGGDAGGASSAAPARGWAGLFGIDVSVSWIPIYGYEGPGYEDIGPGGLWSVTYHPVLIWNVWALYYEATAHGAAERQPADEPMFSLRDLASIGIGVLPVAGAVQSGVELTTGHDHIAGEEASRALAAVGVAAGVFPFGKAALKAGAKLAPKARLLANAARGPSPRRGPLRHLGLPKNTRRVYARDGSGYSVPDALTDRELIEIKDARRVSFTRQLQIQAQFAEDTGRRAILYVGPNTHVTGQVFEHFKVERLPFLGPQ